MCTAVVWMKSKLCFSGVYSLYLISVLGNSDTNKDDRNSTD